MMSNDLPPSNGSNKSGCTTQNHTGPGDNIAGDKNTFQAISPTEIQDIIRNILTGLRHRQTTQAKEQLETLKAATCLNADTTGILNIISILTQLAEGDFPPNAYQQLSTYLITTPDELCADIAISTQIRIDAKNKNLTDARARFISTDNPGVYTKEVFYEFIADESEIEATYKESRLKLDEVELCGLIRGALRLEIPKQALAIAEHLNSVSPTLNSNIFLALSKAALVQSKLERKHYWYITATLRHEILGLCNDVVCLLNDCKGKDARIIDLSTSLLQFVVCEYKPLADTCWSYISEIERQLPEIATRIRFTYERRSDSLDGFLYKIAKASENPFYRKEIITEITNSKEISTENSALLSNIADTKSLRKWLEKGGSVSSKDQFERDFSILELKVLACDNDSNSIEDLGHLADRFISEHKTQLLDINPPILLHLAEKLLDLGLSTAVCELLKPHIPTTDIWVSPIIYCYLEALLNSQQMKTLDTVLSEIDKNDWTRQIWQIKAHQLGGLHNYADAIEAMEMVVEKSPSLPYEWYVLIGLQKNNGSDKNIITTTLDRIPDEVFSRPSKYGYSLLAEIAINGNFTKAEEFLLGWFIEDPDGCSIPFTNFYLKVTIESNTIQRLSNNIGSCFGGICYSSEGKITTKLLVSDDVAPHHTLLSTKSPLGQLLSKMAIGHVEKHGMQDIKLIERPLPYIAAFNIASTLRQAANDGRDFFHSFELPQDPVEMLKGLERKLRSSDENRDILNTNPQIPLFMKGHHQYSSSPVKSALHHLTEKKSVKHPLPRFGDENPDEMILDVYSVIYLSLTGFVFGILKSPSTLIITNETKQYLEDWLKDINRADYLTVGVIPGGGLWRNTAEDIQKQTAEIQSSVRSIIEKSVVVTPNVVDIPPDILKVQDFVDLSVLSSLKLSITNEIPWLCIDEAFAQLSKTFGYRTVNANQFFCLIGHKLSLVQKKQGLSLHLSAALPYPLTFEDMFKLSKSKDNDAHFLLAELIKMYPSAFSSTESATQFLCPVLSSVLINVYSNGEEILNSLKMKNPRNTGHIERVFNICCFTSMQCKDGQEAEKKLAFFLGYLFFIFQEIPSMNRLIQIMASEFIAGHFMSFSAINKHIKDVILKIEKELI